MGLAASREAGALVALGVCCAVVALVFLPFVALSPGGVVWSLRRQLDRPLQIESLGAAVLIALHHAVGMPLGVGELARLPEPDRDGCGRSLRR